MWSDILTKLKQGSVFKIFRGDLMNAPTDNDDDSELLRTHPILPPNEDESKGLSEADKNVLKKRTNSISFAPAVKFTQRTLLRPHVTKVNRERCINCLRTNR